MLKSKLHFKKIGHFTGKLLQDYQSLESKGFSNAFLGRFEIPEIVNL